MALILAKRVRRVCFTLFEEVPPEFEEEWMQYLLVGREVCPATGREHWQGYLELKSQMLWTTVKGRLGDQVHLEECNGSAQDNIVYCSKDGNWVEWGECKVQGARSDLSSLRTDVLNHGVTVAEILEANPMTYHQYGRTLLALEDLRYSRVFRDCSAAPTVTWFWGPTGCGKSHESRARALALAGGDRSKIYVLANHDKGWWDLYNLQEIVILDELRADQVPWGLLLQLTTNVECFVPRRGRQPCPFVAKHVFITSPLHPRDQYADRCGIDNIDQLLRRITFIEERNVPYAAGVFNHSKRLLFQGSMRTERE
ncbi:replication-associated protein [Dragonfly larvae associated circular virus-7]|uniref:replication-associated protein n=1 Tax=Dragonfly larvae associated circular virus-7 TaxID=1454028 RepID=UPI0003E81A84|nr:replication-associated protein [Dragonfly larvae associated circular virus-7]AHH31477.1 replication-associated protein [Dragonfly larvae associated circular virus-7]